MLQLLCLKYHINTIGICQSLSNSALFEHRCLQNINKLYKRYGKCDDQKQFKYILEAAVVYNLGGFTYNSPRSPMNPTPVKKKSARKSLCLFTNILDVKKKTSILQVGSAKLKNKAIKLVTTPWEMKTRQKVNSKINYQIKKSLYNWIMRHPQVVQ